MAGEFVPLVMIPRFTSYLGAAVYTTVALDVSEYYGFVLTFWRGTMLGDPLQGAGFTLTFESSEDGLDGEWAEVPTPPVDDTTTMANGSILIHGDLTRRYLRAKLTMTEDSVRHLVAMTCWASGNLLRREMA